MIWIKEIIESDNEDNKYRWIWWRNRQFENVNFGGFIWCSTWLNHSNKAVRERRIRRRLLASHQHGFLLTFFESVLHVRKICLWRLLMKIWSVILQILIIVLNWKLNIFYSVTKIPNDSNSGMGVVAYIYMYVSFMFDGSVVFVFRLNHVPHYSMFLIFMPPGESWWWLHGDQLLSLSTPIGLVNLIKIKISIWI